MDAHFQISHEVQNAIEQNLPIVALESTIISHGMPYPQNLQTALEVESIVREEGAIPATIAILNGIIHVGLTEMELTQLAKLDLTQVTKCSRRNLSSVIASRGNGSTTVAATMIIAHLAGIDVFVTGGIGGVHRGADETMDISADLTELGRTRVAVVCAGVKSILDIGKTLEVLETQGVSVVSVGSTKFPAFFSSDSGYKSPITVDTPVDCARIIRVQKGLGLESGIVFAVPIPSHEEIELNCIQEAITQALAESQTQQISGSSITPFLLSRVNELTSGKSLTANVALIKNNAAIGARIAIELEHASANPLD